MPRPYYVVGAYASLPASRSEQAAYYELLGNQPWIDGAELPYPGDLADPQQREWLAQHLPAHWHSNTVTLIPGTMQHVGRNAKFGLASPDESGRLAALSMLNEARDAIAQLAALRNSSDVAVVEIHSAPTALANKDAMRRSINELLSWDWSGAQLVIEHCDQYIEGQPPEKGFLSIDDEIDLCRNTDIGLTINWGRSCVEGRDAELPERHIQAAVEADVLHGIMFSGAGPDETSYGYSWIDGHLPMAPDEPTSWMTADRVADCVRSAQQSPRYVGAKVCVPADASLEERLTHLAHIYDAGAMTEAV